MSTFFGLRHMSPKGFSALQQQQKEYQIARRKSDTALTSDSSASNVATTTTGRHSLRPPLKRISPNARTGQERTSSRSFGKVVTQRSSSLAKASLPTESYDLLEANFSLPQLALRISELKQCCETMTTRSSPRVQASQVVDPEVQKEWWTALRVKLQSIQQGLDDVEAERTQLSQTAVSLVTTRNDLQQQLQLRDQEIQSLAKRCAQQADKLTSVHQLQAIHATLAADLHQTIQEYEQQCKLSSQLKDQLECSRQDTERLTQELNRVNQDYEQVTAQLEESARLVQRLTEEKAQWKLERVQLEQQMEASQRKLEMRLSKARGQFEDQLTCKENSIGELKCQVTQLEEKEQMTDNNLRESALQHEKELKTQQKDLEAKRELAVQQCEAEMAELRQSHREEKETLQTSLAEYKHTSEHQIATSTDLCIRLEQTELVRKEEVRQWQERLLTAQEEAEENRSRLELELATETSKGENRLQNLAIQMEQKLAEMQVRVKQTEDCATGEIARLNQDHEGEVSRIQLAIEERERTIQELEDNLCTTIQRHRDELGETLELHVTQVREIQASCEQREARLEATINQQKCEIEDSIEKHKRQSQLFADLKSASQEHLAEQKSYYEKALENQITDARQLAETSRDELEDKANIIIQLEDALAYQEQLYGKLCKESELEGSELRDQHNSLRLELRQEISSLQAQAEQHRIEFSKKAAETDHIEKESEVLRADIDSFKSTLIQSETILSNERADNKRHIELMGEAASQLEAKLVEKASTIDSLQVELDVTMQELMSITGELEKAREDSKLVADLTSDLEAMQLDQSNQEEMLHEKDTYIAELEAEILKLGMENEMEHQRASRAERMCSNFETEIESLEDARESLSIDLRKASLQIDRDRETIDECRVKVKELNEDVMEYKAAAERSGSRREDASSEYRIALEKLKEDHQAEHRTVGENMAALELELGRKIKTLEIEVLAKNDALETATRQLKDARQVANDLSESSYGETSALRRNLHECRLELSSRDDEVQDLRCRAIPRLEGEVAVLTCNVEELQRKHRSLMSEKEIATKERDDLTQVVVEKSINSKAVIDELMRTAETQQTRIEEMNQRLRTENASSEEMKIKISESARQAREAEFSSQEIAELKATVKSLRQQTKRLSSDVHREKSKSTELESAQRKLRWEFNQQARRTALLQSSGEDVVAERDRLLEEVAEKARQSSDALAKSRRLQAELQLCEERKCAAVIRNEELEVSITEVKSDFKNLELLTLVKEDEFAASLEHERALKSLVEDELRELVEKQGRLTKDKQSSTDLKKEVESLKSKIRRQEAFLQRRLNKERMTRQKAAQTQAIFRTERLQPGLRNQAIAAQRGMSDVSSVGWDSSFDTDLDSLLAD
jgi:nucleoprotein TPR